MLLWFYKMHFSRKRQLSSSCLTLKPDYCSICWKGLKPFPHYSGCVRADGPQPIHPGITLVQCDGKLVCHRLDKKKSVPGVKPTSAWRLRFMHLPLGTNLVSGHATEINKAHLAETLSRLPEGVWLQTGHLALCSKMTGHTPLLTLSNVP